MAKEPKEPTKRELLERIVKLERQVNEIRVDRMIDNQDGASLTEYIMEPLKKRQRENQAGKV